MKNNKDILGSVLKTAQMGQTGIRSVLKQNPGMELEKALKNQLYEYDKIESEAIAIAKSRGWKLKELSPVSKLMSDMMSRSMLFPDGSDSKIAAMMIQGNTRGLIKGLKNEHQHRNKDPRIAALSTKLLQCENANIQQMKEHL